MGQKHTFCNKSGRSRLRCRGAKCCRERCRNISTREPGDPGMECLFDRRLFYSNLRFLHTSHAISFLTLLNSITCQDVALSYLTGACGGLIYLRLLKKGVESIGGMNQVSSLAAQPRLLVPVILVMAFNRSVGLLPPTHSCSHSLMWI